MEWCGLVVDREGRGLRLERSTGDTDTLWIGGWIGDGRMDMGF